MKKARILRKATDCGSISTQKRKVAKAQRAFLQGGSTDNRGVGDDVTSL